MDLAKRALLHAIRMPCKHKRPSQEDVKASDRTARLYDACVFLRHDLPEYYALHFRFVPLHLSLKWQIHFTQASNLLSPPSLYSYVCHEGIRRFSRGAPDPPPHDVIDLRWYQTLRKLIGFPVRRLTVGLSRCLCTLMSFK